MQRSIFIVAFCLVVAGCASGPAKEVSCLPGPPPQLAIIETVLAGDAATASTLDAHGTGIGLESDSSSGAPLLVLEPGRTEKDLQVPDALGAELLCVADPKSGSMYNLRGLNDGQINELLKGFGAGSPIRFLFKKGGTVQEKSVIRLGYPAEG